jgi:hypothetical protein
MVVKENKFYFVSNEYFAVIADPNLTVTTNQKFGEKTKRPHYFALRDNKQPCIYWMIPCTTKYKKKHRDTGSSPV